MTSTIKQKESKTNKRGFFDILTEIVGWIQIVASPLLLGAIIGAFIYFSDPTTTRLVIGIVITSIGLIIGAIFATRVWKKSGTMHFLSRISATPELDKNDGE